MPPHPAPGRSFSMASLADLRAEAAGGIMAALFLLPNLLGVGVVATAPLGPDWLAAGIQGAFAACIVVALMRAALGGAFHVNAPRATQSAMLAALMMQLAVAAPILAAEPGQRAPLLFAATFLSLAAAGAMQCALGLAKAGGVIRFIPFPVAAGFVNGFAGAVAIGMLPALVGLHGWKEVGAALNDPFRLSPWPAVCGLSALAATLAAPRWSKRIPAGFVGLGVGGALYALLSVAAPGARAAIPTVGDFAAGLPFVWTGDDMAALVASPGFFSAMLKPILATAATLAAVASLQSLVSLTTADALTGRRSDGDGELLRQGLGNLGAAFAGGTAIGGSPLYTRTAWDNGGRSGWAQVFLAAALLAAVTLLAPVVAAAPLAALAGVVVASMVGALDPWSLGLVRRLRGKDGAGARRGALLADLAIVVAVAGTVVFAGALSALGVGLGLAVLVYLWRSGGGVTRGVSDAARMRSQTARDGRALAALERDGGRVKIVFLQGMVFFGTAERLADAALAACGSDHVDSVILDFSRVATIDSTGVQVLKRLDGEVKRAKRRLLLAGLAADDPHRALLADMGWGEPVKEGRVFADLNAALSAAEDRLLAAAGASGLDGEIPVAAHPSLKGLNGAQLDILETVLERRTPAAGEQLFSQGDAADGVWLLAKGAVLALRAGADGVEKRIGGFRAGSAVGERALFERAPRQATARAEEGVVAYFLRRDDLEMLGRIDWRIPFILLRNVATALAAQNQRLADQAWDRT